MLACVPSQESHTLTIFCIPAIISIQLRMFPLTHNFPFTSSPINHPISDVIILSIVEAAVGLIASCLATLKPLIRSFLDWSEKSIGSSGGLHTRMMDGMNRRRTKMYDTELNLRPDLAIVGFTTTVISSNGRESPPLHPSISQTMDVKSDVWLSPSSHGSQKTHRRLESGNGDQAAVPACQIK